MFITVPSPRLLRPQVAVPEIVYERAFACKILSEVVEYMLAYPCDLEKKGCFEIEFTGPGCKAVRDMVVTALNNQGWEAEWELYKYQVPLLTIKEMSVEQLQSNWGNQRLI